MNTQQDYSLAVLAFGLERTLRECDSFQDAVPCWQRSQSLLFESCVYCHAEVYPAWNTRLSRTYNCKCGRSFKTYGEILPN